MLQRQASRREAGGKVYRRNIYLARDDMTFLNTPDEWIASKQSLILEDGRNLAYIDRGDPGPTLLMIYGFTDSSRSFEPFIPLLHEFRLILPDLRGHGGSSGGQGSAIGDFANDLETLIDTLHLQNVSLIGHSMGAMTALELANRRAPQVEQIVLISGSLRPRFAAGSAVVAGIEALADPINPDSAFMHEWHSCSIPVDLHFLSQMRCEAARIPASFWKSILRELQATDLTLTARNVFTRTLCIGGSMDPLFDGQHLQHLGATLPNCQTMLLPDHGHNPHWEDPEHIAALITEFLQSVRN